LLGIAGLLFQIANPSKLSAQGISFSGVTEGGAVSLAAGATMTNLAVMAMPSSPAGTTNVAFALERQGALFLNLTSAPPYSVTLTGLTVGKYFLTAKLVGGVPSGDISFDVKPASLQPANDNWSSAAVIPGLNVTVTNSNVFATAEPNEPRHADMGVGKSIWWAWTAPSNGTYTATTLGSSFDTALGIYTGTNVSTLNEVAANDDIGPYMSSEVTFTATNGTVYYFAVDGASDSAYGQAWLRVSADPLPVISITSPANGVSLLVSSASKTTNTQASASIVDPSGIAQVNYWFNGPGTNFSGALSSPYQLSVTNLTTGHYELTLVAANNGGLIGVTNIGFSVISIAPQIVLSEFAQSGTQFQFGVLGYQGTNYDLEVSTNLSTWSAATHWTNFTGAEIVNNTNVNSALKQFYRAVLK
jgi:hypothetical protein